MKHAPSDGAGVTQSSAEWRKTEMGKGCVSSRCSLSVSDFSLSNEGWRARERERERRYGCDFAERRKEVKRTLSLGGGALPRGGKKNFTLTVCLTWPYHSVSEPVVLFSEPRSDAGLHQRGICDLLDSCRLVRNRLR